MKMIVWFTMITMTSHFDIIAQAHAKAKHRHDIKKAVIGVTNCLTIGGEAILFDNGAIERPENHTFAFTDGTGTRHRFTGGSVQAARDNLIAWLQSDRVQAPSDRACLHCGGGLTDKRRKYCNVRCRMAYYETENQRIRDSRYAA